MHAIFWLENEKGKCGLDESGSGEGPVVDPCKHSNEPLCSKAGNFLIS
jgi:hypothetical protein